MLDAIVVGGGHNGLVAAAYLARAGRRVLVLERLAHCGGAAVSQRPWPGVDARVSRYAYLVSLLPPRITADLGVDVELRARRLAWCAPDPRTGARTSVLAAPTALEARLGRFAAAVFPTMTAPLPAQAALRAAVGDDELWSALTQRPLGELLEAQIDDDLVRGVALTDGLIGVGSHAHDPTLLQNRCFLYHVLGGEWKVPVGGMGALTAAIENAARSAGAEIRTGAEVTAIAADDDGAEVTWREDGSTRRARTGRVLGAVAPTVLAALLGDQPPPGPAPRGAQLKVNMLLARLPALRDPSLAAVDAFAGTLHINESYSQLEAGYRAYAAGLLPDPIPCEVYCHSLTDPTILGAELRASGAQTLTCFALHVGPEADREQALAATLRSLDSVLAEPLEGCLYRDADGAPCIEARTGADLEAELALPGGHIFHRDLAWPFAERDDEVGTRGVETERAAVLLCAAGARRGGGVSGIPGFHAAAAVLDQRPTL